ncbi:MAG: hypothetical protein IPO80_02625, partial [Propionibacteriaceae bacterium]|nr:hypothetical protein [Propionibacteriaceae bacterium]
MFCVFQLVWTLSPIGDAAVFLTLITGSRAVVVSYLTFLAMDLIASTIAYKLDDEPVRGMWPILIQRFYYRQF